MASIHRIILLSGQWVKVPEDADVNYFGAVKESELATASIFSSKSAKQPAISLIATSVNASTTPSAFYHRPASLPPEC